ncbi:MAG: flavin reductase family protein [Candidatus Bathyarchaeota archaeon]|nr:flavin reductase family protein [Candidatus Bathyarchaeota archaeon]
MSGKVEVNSQYSYRLIHPMHTFLVSCAGADGKPNVSAVAWVMPVSNDPALVAISLSPKRHSHTLIEASQEFVINVPTLELLQSVYACGSFSGRSFDKFKKAGLTAAPAKKVKAPIVQECIAHIECKVYDQVTAGDHTLFIGKILQTYADPGVFTERYSLENAKMLYHAGGNNFALLDPKIYKP